MKLAYREFGSGQPLIILHGLFGQSDNWNTLAKQFAEKGFHVFTIDQRNHGLSPHSETWDYNAMADDLKEFLEEHNLHHAILLGHSMGGKTVLFFEWKYPEVAEKLIVVDISTRSYPPHHSDVLAALHAVDLKKINTRKEADEKMSAFISDYGTKQFLLKNIYWKDSESKEMDWRFNLNVISKEYDNISVAVPEFKSFTDTLIVRGEKSNYIGENDLTEFKKRFVSCTFETVAGSGHWVHAEKPKEFFEVVMNFLQDQNP